MAQDHFKTPLRSSGHQTSEHLYCFGEYFLSTRVEEMIGFACETVLQKVVVYVHVFMIRLAQIFFPQTCCNRSASDITISSCGVAVAKCTSPDQGSREQFDSGRREVKGWRQGPRTKHQEPRTENQGPRTKYQEPRTGTQGLRIAD